MSEPKWLSPRTSRVYLHAPFARRLCLLFPDFKVCSLELNYSRHVDLPGYAVTLLDGAPGEESQLCYEDSVFDEVRGGEPVYTLRNKLKTGACVSMTAFADAAENPAMYSEYRLYNPENYEISGNLTLFLRTADLDHYITNLRDTGYDPYIPNVKTQYMLPSFWKPVSCDTASDGYASCRVDPGKLKLSWVDSEMQPKHFAASDCWRLDYTLAPGESAVFTAVSRYGGLDGLCGYDEACSNNIEFWRDIMAKVKIKPASDTPRIQAMYRQLIVQSLQMLAKYDDMEGVIPRQGDVGRYCWSWEAPHYLLPLDRIGLSEYTADAFRTLVVRWQNRDESSPDYGRMMSPNVHWDNSTGKTLEGAARHLLYTSDGALFDEFRPHLLLGFEWCEKKRRESEGKEGVTPGLFPEGQASDWGEIGQHWTFTDAVNVSGYKWLYECFERFGDPEYLRIKAAYEDYLAAVRGVLEAEMRGHEDDKAFMPSHITHHDFESMRRHCYYTDGSPYLYLCGIIGADHPVIAQMEEYYRLHGLIDHGLMGRLTNNSDLTNYNYGDVYYVGVAEVLWIYPWLASGQREKATEAFNALMKYGITREFVTSERYCSRDEWYTPWMPNASANGRWIELLLEVYSAY
ncbi:MAG: hypothetical protein GX827_05735 [Clostridiales bacterium]|jgi:hypothetical protein|nr:hypothetical protein [Clostridiales bacterium]